MKLKRCPRCKLPVGQMKVHRPGAGVKLLSHLVQGLGLGNVGYEMRQGGLQCRCGFEMRAQRKRTTRRH
jgi:hypothetical protein